MTAPYLAFCPRWRQTVEKARGCCSFIRCRVHSVGLEAGCCSGIYGGSVLGDPALFVQFRTQNSFGLGYRSFLDIQPSVQRASHFINLV
jgi:hypothetical protein